MARKAKKVRSVSGSEKRYKEMTMGRKKKSKKSKKIKKDSNKNSSKKK